jgi:N-acetylglucosamine repressor
MALWLEKATHQHTKDHNSRLVLRAIYDAGTMSRAGLARLTGLTRTTVSEVVANLMAHELIEEVGQGPTGVGRTPTLLSVVEDGRHIVAVTIRSDEIHGALVNLRGVIRREARLPLPSGKAEDIQGLLFPLLDSLTRSSPSPLLGIGISSPGLIDAANGTVRRAVNLGWENLPLRAIVQERYALPVYVANDSHMAVLAEYLFGQQHSPSLIVVKVGQGIGAGIVLDGQLLSSASFGTGEIGHVVVEAAGPRCICGNAGCLEALANVVAITRAAQTVAVHQPHGTLRRMADAQGALTFDTVLRAFAAGDPALPPIVRDVGRYLGVAVANLVGILGIRRVVITGRIAPFGAVLRDAVRAELQQRLLPELAQAAEIEVLDQGPDAVLLGAAALLLTNELGLARLVLHHEPEPVGG